MRRVLALCLTSTLLTALPTFSHAEELSPWLLRARVLHVSPQESATVTPLGGTVDADSATVPELDITYFFTPHIAAELIAATTPHDMSASAGGGLDLGEVWLLPPTLTLQYHFLPNASVRPYVGAGLNYTLFYNEKAGSSINDIEYENGFGYALQAGIDIPIDTHWSVNFDVKKLWLNTDVKINNAAVRADVDLDPWIIGLGIGYRF